MFLIRWLFIFDDGKITLFFYSYISIYKTYANRIINIKFLPKKLCQ